MHKRIGAEKKTSKNSRGKTKKAKAKDRKR